MERRKRWHYASARSWNKISRWGDNRRAWSQSRSVTSCRNGSRDMLQFPRTPKAIPTIMQLSLPRFHGTVVLDMVWNPVNRTYCGEASEHSKLHTESGRLSGLGLPMGRSVSRRRAFAFPGLRINRPASVASPVGRDFGRRCSQYFEVDTLSSTFNRSTAGCPGCSTMLTDPSESMGYFTRNS